MTNHKSSNDDLELISQPEVLEIFGLSPMTLWRWRKAREFPREVRVQRRVFFRKSEIAQFIDDHTSPSQAI